jgi:hypothetical protein
MTNRSRWCLPLVVKKGREKKAEGLKIIPPPSSFFWTSIFTMRCRRAAVRHRDVLYAEDAGAFFGPNRVAISRTPRLLVALSARLQKKAPRCGADFLESGGGCSLQLTNLLQKFPDTRKNTGESNWVRRRNFKLRVNYPNNQSFIVELKLCTNTEQGIIRD